MKNAPNVKTLPKDKTEEVIIFVGSNAWNASQDYSKMAEDTYKPVVLDTRQLQELEELKIIDEGRRFVRVYQAGLIDGAKLLSIAAMLGKAGVVNAQLYDAVSDELLEDWTPRLKELAKQCEPKNTEKYTDVPYGFRLESDALWFDKEAQNRDGEKEVTPIRVCSPLRVTAISSDVNEGCFGRLLEWMTITGAPKKWAMPMEMLSGNGDELRRVLLSNGLTYIGTSALQRNLLLDYIALSKPERTVICVNRTGWHENSYVLPDAVIGKNSNDVILQASSYQPPDFKLSGTLEDWKREIGSLCIGNSRLTFAVCCALAAPLLKLVGMDGGGYHLKGESSDGKSTVMKVASSVCGASDYWHTWRATGNAIESIANRRNDALLLMDELREVDPREAGQIAYMLANGRGKGRARQDGEMKARKEWRLLFFSTGELSLAEHAEKAGERTYAGMDVRMVQIPSDTGKFGAFEDIHGHEGGKEFADKLCSLVGKYHGSPFRAWLDFLTVNADESVHVVNELHRKYSKSLMLENAGNQAGRIISRFALVAVAGEMATECGITGWNIGDAYKSVETCIDAWIQDRGHLDNHENISVVEQIKSFFTANQYSRFATWDGSDRPHNMVGYRKIVKNLTTSEEETEFYVLPTGWKEICKGFDPVKSAKLCHELGVLKSTGEYLQCQSRLPGVGKRWVYRITSDILDLVK